MARMIGRRVWRGQTVEATPLTRKHWRARERRQWRREARAAASMTTGLPPSAG